MKSPAMDKHESKYFHTAELMDEALIELLDKKDYAYISAKELCEKAGVNRSTFYLHYESMDDLLKETVSRVLKGFYMSFGDNGELDKAISKGERNGVSLISERYMKPYLSFVKENRKVFVLAKSKPELFRSKEEYDFIFHNYLSPIMEIYGLPEWERAYVASYYLNGIVALVGNWVGGGCKEETEQISSLILQLVYPKWQTDAKKGN